VRDPASTALGGLDWEQSDDAECAVRRRISRMPQPPTDKLLHEEITHSIIGGFYTVHHLLGYGFSEYVYSAVLERELTRRGHKVAREVRIPVYYLGELVCYRSVDLLVDDVIIVENKTGERLREGADSQLLNYLRCARLEVGLLFYLGRKPSLFRVINSLPHDTPPRPRGESSAEGRRMPRRNLG
jgi:GxxExxY protein